MSDEDYGKAVIVMEWDLTALANEGLSPLDFQKAGDDILDYARKRTFPPAAHGYIAIKESADAVLDVFTHTGKFKTDE